MTSVRVANSAVTEYSTTGDERSERISWFTRGPALTDEDEALVLVVINDEEQYSIWPADRSVPSGWCAVTSPASREWSLDYIEATWTDMRPRSARGEQ